MKTETKQLTVEKMDAAGHGLARIAILSEIDHDGDTYAKGAFSWKAKGEQWVPILPAHNRAAMPLGKARVYEDGDAVFAELHLNLNTPAGRDWHETLKFDLETGGAVQEWSYGFGVVDHAKETRDGAAVRVLKRVDVHEVSPVVRGAGVGTRTLSMKAKDAMPCAACEGTGKTHGSDDACPTCKGTGEAEAPADDEAMAEAETILSAIEHLQQVTAMLSQLQGGNDG